MKAALVNLLRLPAGADSLQDSDWNAIIPQARKTLLLGTLLAELEAAGLREHVPGEVWRHLYSGWAVHRKQRHALGYELRKLGAALAEAGERLVLLKGAAYFRADLPPATGRLISDIDILVRPGKLGEVESALARHGWSPGDIDAYNERYYRQWMHEIPPLGHSRRHSTLDVHHTILPPTSDAHIDAGALWEAAVEVAPGVWTLAPVDMVLHSAAHLFHEGEFGHGLRDLVDLDKLLRHFVAHDGEAFYAALAERAVAMGLQRPLFYALRYTRRVLGTPVPESFATSLMPESPSPVGRRTMDFLFYRAFTPDHASCRLPLTDAALFGLYVRSHYLRMPLGLLIPHLVRKAWMGIFPPADSSTGEDGDAQKAGG